MCVWKERLSRSDNRHDYGNGVWGGSPVPERSGGDMILGSVVWYSMGAVVIEWDFWVDLWWFRSGRE